MTHKPLQSDAHSPASVGAMWRVLSDVDRWPELLPTMTSIEPLQVTGPPGVGSRYRMRQPGLAAAVYEITEWYPLSGFVWVARAVGVVTTARHAIAEVETGSHLKLEIEWSGSLTHVINRLYRGKALHMIETEAATFARLAATD